MSKDEKLYDVRVADRYIKEGMLTKKNYEGYIKKLPDVSDKSEILNIDEEIDQEEIAEENPANENELANDEENEIE